MKDAAPGFGEILKTRLDEEAYRRLLRIDNPALHHFVAKYVELCNPDRVYVSQGSAEDIEYIKNTAVKNGEEIKLATEGHTVHFDNYKDQARDREHTLLLVSKGRELGPKLRTGDREEKLKEIHEILKNIMQGHELYVCFYTLGPAGSEFTIPCVQLTDSSYVAHSENILYRQGYEEFVRQGRQARPFKFVHSQGKLDERKTSTNLDKRRIYIDIEGDTVYSANTQYGGNSIGLKKLAMRLAINRASKEGWLTEHMLIMGIHGPKGRVTYFTGAFPSMCGKTSTAMLDGETIVGDDIAYLRKKNGRVRAVNVEKGVFGIIQGINSKDDPIQWEVLHSPVEVIFSNVLVTEDGHVHWTGKDGEVPLRGYNHSGEWWKGKKDEKGKEIPCSHPNARFTVELKYFKNLDPRLDDPEGVVLDAIVYGGRDSNTWVPVEESFNWEHGIITKGASLESESTAATLGAEGVREFNPMSNLDFLSIPIGRYIEDNINFGKDLAKPPRIFAVNYFLKGEDGNFLTEKTDKKVWFKWMELRVHEDVGAIDTPTGRIPVYEDLRKLFQLVLDRHYAKEAYIKQFTVRVQENLAKIDRITKIYRELTSVPSRVFEVLEEQRQRLIRAREKYGDYISPFELAS
ncbi:phosphoenolpyruvate carboxykinase (GTP) [Candidatus Hecatella orcuttiae]|uniref:phosphoenolpyruvate carboxykinase (GTP) n=1 Tax=Candidatus Hecatella orcuttiae TaxID=1935119 RepID=UPI00286838E9|nr:phosphoenolpyruvate carboxykinase (GTP) [Candidatus Hecatella orcuttiae]